MKNIYLHNSDQDLCSEHIEFPSGESHIRITGIEPGTDVTLHYEDSTGDLMKLGMAVDILRRAKVGKIILKMPFVPFARQDRIAANGDPLSIKVFANFINSLGLDEVIITDPHSDVTPALINNVKVVHQYEIAQWAWLNFKNRVDMQEVLLVAPDLGAAKKVKQLQKYLLEQYRYTVKTVQCDKTRDPVSGQITGFKVLDNSPHGKHCLVVDDICDGGGTFIGVANILKQYQAKSLGLYVTHGIFSKGVEHLLSIYDCIYTSHSLPPIEGTIRV